MRVVAVFYSHRLLLTVALFIQVVEADPIKTAITKTHQWAVVVKDDGEATARQLAIQLGLRYKRRIGTLLQAHLFEGQWPTAHRLSEFDSPNRKRTALIASHRWANDVETRLGQQTGVVYAKRQIAMKRVKRIADIITGDDSKTLFFNDKWWHKSWYLLSGAKGGYDMNVRPVWQTGFTGKGVVITVLDDGIERSHPDLAGNYDESASWDFNDNDKDPSPRYDSYDTNHHGTRCAGQIAAFANNTICTVGIAFGAKVGGIRMLGGDVTDAVEASALTFNSQHIDIYSSSWGPPDNGKTVAGPLKLARDAFVKGVLTGRGGKGSIYIWASGNGGGNGDSCACDGYASSIYTLSISSVSENGDTPWYLERCASTLATTYSSGRSSERQVVTTDIRQSCATNHSGTSASAAMATGMVALMLEANQNLTWRDVQHIVVETARPDPLEDGDWMFNGIQIRFSDRYGFGLMDGYGMVQLAQRWKTVPPQRMCKAYKENNPWVMVQGLDRLVLDAVVDACQDSGDEVRYLEHVQLQMTMNYSRRGDLTIFLTSPNGTKSLLLPQRPRDIAPGEFLDWSFMSVHFWGELAFGRWRLEIVNNGSVDNHGVLKYWRLVLFGTDLEPESSTLTRIRIDQPSTVGTLTSSTTPNSMLTRIKPVPPNKTFIKQGVASSSSRLGVLHPIIVAFLYFRSAYIFGT